MYLRMSNKKLNYYRQRVYATRNACIRLAMEVEQAQTQGTMTTGLEIRHQRTCEALASWEAKLEAERFRAPEGFMAERATGKDGLPRFRLVRTDGTVFANWTHESRFVRVLNQLRKVEAELQEVNNEA